jgi:hypothetical protein
MKFLHITVLLFSLILCSSVSPQERGSKIRAVNFANFTYPWVADLGDTDKSFTLKNGKLPATWAQ